MNNKPLNNGSILSQSIVDLSLRDSQLGEAQHCPASVAHTRREAGEQLATSDVANSPNYNEWIFTLLSYVDTNVGLGSTKNAKKFLEKMWKANPTMIAVVHHIRLHHATIIKYIAEDLELSETQVYRLVTQLKEWGIVKFAGSIDNRRKGGVKGGPQPQIITLAGKIYPEEILALREKYFKDQNPALAELKRIIPMLIDEYVDPNSKEITYRQIVNKVRDTLPGYKFAPLADECARNLHEMGIKVWR